MREPDPALVEDDQIARRGDRAEQFGELFGERERRLSGAARERDDRAAGFADRRAVPAQRERRACPASRRRGRAGRPDGAQAKLLLSPARRECDLRRRHGAAPPQAPPQSAARSRCHASSHHRNLPILDLARRRAPAAGRRARVASMSSERETVRLRTRRPAIGPYSHARARRRAAVLLRPDPARRGHRRARRSDGGRAGAALPGEPAGGLRGRRHRARARRADDRLHDRPGGFAEVNEVYGSFFDGDEPPARVAIGVAALPRAPRRDRRGRRALGGAGGGVRPRRAASAAGSTPRSARSSSRQSIGARRASSACRTSSSIALLRPLGALERACARPSSAARGGGGGRAGRAAAST